MLESGWMWERKITGKNMTQICVWIDLFLIRPKGKLSDLMESIFGPNQSVAEMLSYL